jgi:hypothetical protein
MEVTCVSGQAGTGKTTWLMRTAQESAKEHIIADHQRMLAITRMHGARRRVEIQLKDKCTDVPRIVNTIDAFALSILNRWRIALGYLKPITPVSHESNFTPSLFGIEADFTNILSKAADLLESNTIGKIIGQSFPLIMVDEFQDCHGAMLDFVKALSNHSNLLLAGDDFQLLDISGTGCPALEWVKELEKKGHARIEELRDFHRTSSTEILQAARCLRENVNSSGQSIPVICCPNHGPAAWHIISRLVISSSPYKWTGDCALICPGHDPFLQKVLGSCAKQLRDRRLFPLQWREELTADEERRQVLTALNLSDDSHTSEADWRGPTNECGCIGKHVTDFAERLCKLRGVEAIPESFVAKQVDRTIHEMRAYCLHTGRRTVTTVHGAKNREFDNVFVLWTYKVPPDSEQQRRWLYNAVTRSKKNCVILVWGSEDRARNDPILSLLGPPQPAFPKKKRATSSSRKSYKKVENR